MTHVPLNEFDPSAIGKVCLVTGGAGYLGRHLAQALVAIGCKVRSYDMHPCPIDGVDSIMGDIRDLADLREAFRGVDTVFHTAAVIALAGIAPKSTRERVFSINTEGTQQVIRACHETGAGALIYTSSTNVCVDREVVEVGEEAPYATKFVDVYGPSKIQAEQSVLQANGDQLKTCALRPGGIWGGGDGGFMVRAFLKQVAQGAFVATIGDGQAVVDNSHVDNVVYAQCLAAVALHANKPGVCGQPFFITDDERVNGITWFKPIADGLGVRWPTFRLPGRLMYTVGLIGEIAHWFGAPEPSLTRIGVLKLMKSSAFKVDRAREQLGWRVLVKHEEGIREHLADYRASLEAYRG